MADAWQELFGGAPEIVASAPGRVNLIGEHTDYNGGFVLPMAIPQRTTVQLRRTQGKEVRVASAGLGPPQTFTLGEERKGHGWLDYIQGVTWVLRRADHATHGCSLRIESDVPVGSGLSSSAALSVSLLRAFREAFRLSIDDVRIAQLAQKVETDFVGAPIGIMDQMASSLADASTALFLDTRTLQFERVPLPPALEIVVLDSGITHSHATGDYRKRRAECEEAARLLGVKQLRDANEEDLTRIRALPDPLGRRARHVVTEDARVLAAVEALRKGDGARLGRLFLESHASMRDDFEVSVPGVDRLVELACEEPDVLGARLTGGGFGGSIVALVRRGTGASVASRTLERARRAGLRPTVLVPSHRP